MLNIPDLYMYFFFGFLFESVTSSGWSPHELIRFLSFNVISVWKQWLHSFQTSSFSTTDNTSLGASKLCGFFVGVLFWMYSELDKYIL